MLRKAPEQGRRKRHKFNDVRAVTVFTAFLALVAGFQAWMMYTGGKDTHALAVAAQQQSIAAKKLALQASKQVDAMQSQNKKLQQSLQETETLVTAEKSQAESTRRLANASNQSASNALGALRLAQQSDRAWLSISLHAPAPHAGTPSQVTGTIQNVGHAAAFVDQSTVAAGDPTIVAWEIYKASGRPPYPNNPQNINSRSILFPGQPEELLLKGKQSVMFREYNQGLLGARHFYMWARVKYRSSGDPKEHYTHVCVEWSPTYKQWQNCSWYNNAD